jgi:hypothetical protein
MDAFKNQICQFTKIVNDIFSCRWTNVQCTSRILFSAHVDNMAINVNISYTKQQDNIKMILFMMKVLLTEML